MRHCPCMVFCLRVRRMQFRVWSVGPQSTFSSLSCDAKCKSGPLWCFALPVCRVICWTTWLALLGWHSFLEGEGWADCRFHYTQGGDGFNTPRVVLVSPHPRGCWFHHTQGCNNFTKPRALLVSPQPVVVLSSPHPYQCPGKQMPS